jgi:DNA (cytosine-5)-methyltransferase 1
MSSITSAQVAGIAGLNNKIDYPAHLEAMWQKHLAPRTDDAPTVISTFAGGGGSSLGYSMAGFRELLAVEWDNNAVETFKLNFPDVPVYHGDIAKLSVDECLSLAGIAPGKLDIFDGSPPCQGFSTAGKRILDDPRNQLFKEYVRLLRGLRPKVFVMENVSGMIKGKMKLVFVEILKELKASGYKVSARLLNAMYFHVPQSRQRLIFIGVRDDLGIDPSHPKAEAQPMGAKVISSSSIDGINGEFLTLNGKTSELIKMLKPGQRLEQLYEQVHGKGKKAYFAFSRTHPDKPARTIAKDSAGLFHYLEDRTLTVGEYKRIASFPDNFQFIGTFSVALQRIGNSVPPLFMEAIARHIRENIISTIDGIKNGK